MNRNKIVEWYCPDCKKIVRPQQRLVPTSKGMVAVDVNPKTCPNCRAHLQRHVTKVKADVAKDNPKV